MGFLSLAPALAALPAGAQENAFQNIYNYQYEHLNRHYIYVDFGQESPIGGRPGYAVWFNQGSNKYMDIRFSQPSGSAGKCYQYQFFGAPNGVPHPDWDLYTNRGTTTSPVWQKLADNNGPNGPTPIVRLWIVGSASASKVVLRVSSVNEDGDNNFGAAIMEINTRDDLNEASCLNFSASLKVSNGTVVSYRQGS